MIIKTLQVGMIGTNCYIVGCPDTKEAAVIDPGDEAQKIMKVVKDNGLKVTVIINTHGHWDHVGGNIELSEMTGAPIMIHEKDESFLKEGKFYAPNKLLKEGDQVKIGNINLMVVHTPGHTPGGICLIGQDVVFVGDTLFAGSIGRTDLPGGSFKTIIKSIKEKLLPLDDKYIAYPGHGPSTTIGEERLSNPFLQ